MNSNDGAAKGKGKHSRRSFVKGVAGAGLAAGALGKAALVPGCDDENPPPPPPSNKVDGGSTPDAATGKKVLKILHSTHYVPAFNDWMKEMAKSWGDANNVDVQFTYMTSSADVLRRRDEEILGTAERHDLWYVVAPPADVEQNLLDLSDLHAALEKELGAQVPLAKASGYNPHTKKHYALCTGYWSNPSNYLKSLWTAAGKADGPTTWTDLLETGEMIKNSTAAGATPGKIVGLSLNHRGGKHKGAEWDADAEASLFGLMLAFGGMIQDAESQLVIHRDGVREKVAAALDFMHDLYTKTMTPNVISWVPRSNNNALTSNPGRPEWLEYPIAPASYVQNAMSVYRGAQDGDATSKAIAEDIHFGGALSGPTSWKGATMTPQTITLAQGFAIYAIPSFNKDPQPAKDFIFNLCKNHSEATYKSKLYNHPAFPKAVPLLNDWYGQDPLSTPSNSKLKVFQTVDAWSVAFGHPGPANAAIGETVFRSIIPEMFARAAAGTWEVDHWTGAQPADMVVQWAFEQLKAIYTKWAKIGLIPEQKYLG